GAAPRPRSLGLPRGRLSAGRPRRACSSTPLPGAARSPAGALRDPDPLPVERRLRASPRGVLRLRGGGDGAGHQPAGAPGPPSPLAGAPRPWGVAAPPPWPPPPRLYRRALRARGPSAPPCRRDPFAAVAAFTCSQVLSDGSPRRRSGHAIADVIAPRERDRSR